MIQNFTYRLVSRQIVSQAVQVESSAASEKCRKGKQINAPYPPTFLRLRCSIKRKKKMKKKLAHFSLHFML